jgi:hypothetical protein
VQPKRSVLYAGLVLAVAVSACSSSPGSKSAPHLEDPTTAAGPLVDRFFTLIEEKDAAGLQEFLSPAFQVERADGSGSAKSQYLTQLPTVTKFDISQLAATQQGGALIVRYLATVEGVVNGKPYTPGPAPRLSVFVWNGTAWQLAAHANFNPLTG